jgi:hypothetical protein
MGPARPADLPRGHWSIENGLHRVRDVTFTQDASQVRSGTAPQVMACLRNLAIGVLCRAGPVDLAAALRFHSRDPSTSTTSRLVGTRAPMLACGRRAHQRATRSGSLVAAYRPWHSSWAQSAAGWGR